MGSVTDRHESELVPIALQHQTKALSELMDSDYFVEVRKITTGDDAGRWFLRIFLGGQGPIRGRWLHDTASFDNPGDATVACEEFVAGHKVNRVASVAKAVKEA